MFKKLFIGCLALITLAACSDHKEPNKETPQVQGVIPQAQLDALNKSKGVEETLQQSEQQRRTEMDAQ